MLALYSEKEVQKILAEKLKARRLELNFSRRTTALKSGVSLGSLCRFERTGEISLKSFVLLASFLGRSDELVELFKPRLPATISDLPRQRTKGRL